MMNTKKILPALALALPGALFAHQGRVDTLERGEWRCETPGDAAIGPGIRDPERDFTVLNSSRYRDMNGTGNYLRTGDLVRMTSGPRKGENYIVSGERFIELVNAEGLKLGVRCIRRGG